jgi:hypothetical protein
MKQVPNEFNLDRIRAWVHQFSFPRLIGTQGEKKARNLSFSEFKKLGLEPEREAFICSLFYSKWLLPFTITFLTLVLILTQVISFMFPTYRFYAFLGFMGCFLLTLEYMLRKNRNPQKIMIAPNYHSENIFVDIPPKETTKEKDIGHIIISAHSDSKSQRFTTLFRIKLFRNALIIFIIFMVVNFLLYSLDYVFENSLGILILIISFLTTFTIIVFNIMLYMNRNGNASVGALDNASGIASVLALSDYFKSHPLENFHVWCVVFGVEEFGQPGARNFILQRLNIFQKYRIFNFNLDMVGEISDEKLNICEFHGLNHKPVDPFLMEYIRKSSEKLGIGLLGFNLPTGARTDRKVFTHFGFNGIDFASRNAAKWTHTPKDTVDKVNFERIQDACAIISQSALELDEALRNRELPSPIEAKYLRHAYK